MKTKKIDRDTLGHLGALKVDGATIVIPMKLDRPAYEKVNAVLEAMGGKWNRKAKAHVFADDPEDVLDVVLATGEVTDIKKALEQFYTPPPLARRLVSEAGVMAGHVVLEPSAGRGAIVTELLVRGAIPYVVELDPKSYAVLAEMHFPAGGIVICGDFLTEPIHGGDFDRVVMNPPFSRQADIDHVTKAFSLLRKGGRLVSVMSPAIFFRQNAKTNTFRKLVNEYGSMEALPEKSFHESGTDIDTFMVVLDK